MMMKKVQQGFTLIELMIVVAIIGILAAVAIPQYVDYTVRAKLANAISTVESLKMGVAEYFQAEGVYPDALTDIGLSAAPTSNEVSASALAADASGTITATLQAIKNPEVDGGIITFTPRFNVGDTVMKWDVSWDRANSYPAVDNFIAKVDAQGS